MYTREQISKQKQAFWTAFGKYMQPILSAEGLPVSWMNYKTGIVGIQFKMDVDQDRAVIMILCQQSYYDQFVALKGMLEESLGEDDWTWNPTETEKTSSISKTLKGVNIHNQSHWAAIISFLKPKIIALDAFWSMAKYSFEQ